MLALRIVGVRDDPAHAGGAGQIWPMGIASAGPISGRAPSRAPGTTGSKPSNAVALPSHPCLHVCWHRHRTCRLDRLPVRDKAWFLVLATSLTRPLTVDCSRGRGRGALRREGGASLKSLKLCKTRQCTSCARQEPCATAGSRLCI